MSKESPWILFANFLDWTKGKSVFPTGLIIVHAKKITNQQLTVEVL
jgi:hypothetical protein